MEEIVYGTSVTPQEYNQLRMAVGWYELTQRQAREGLAHTTFVACARVGGVCVAMGRILFDYGYTAYLGGCGRPARLAGPGDCRQIVEQLCQRVLDAAQRGRPSCSSWGRPRGRSPSTKSWALRPAPATPPAAACERR